MLVSTLNGKWAVKCSIFENERVQSLPKRQFKKKFGMWSVDACFDNARHFRQHFKPSEFTPDALALIKTVLESARPMEIKDAFPDSILAGMRDHQQDCLRLAWSEPAFGILHRPRCGKTATTIRLSCGRFSVDQITRLVVFCPTSIKTVWQEQFEQWHTAPYSLHILESGASEVKKFRKWMASTDQNSLRVLVVGIEAMSQGNAIDLVGEFMGVVIDGKIGNATDTMAVVDESTRIKNHKSIRTKNVWDVGAHAKYRNILTGSEITREPEDLFAQFRYLGIHVLGYDSFYAWRNRYCMMGGFEGRKVVGIKNAAELMARLAKYSHLVKTSDIVDLPEKTFITRVVKPTPEQVRMVKELQKTLDTSYMDGTATAANIMVMLLRCQQIAGGFFPSDQEDGAAKPVALDKNPKLDELMDILAEEQGKVIIWARFKPEISQISATIAAKYGDDAVVQFHGGVDDEGRRKARNEFQTNPRVMYFVGNATVGSMGIELSQADTMIYYSQDNTYESRIQSLERATNLSKKTGVGVIDMVLDVKADWQIIHANANKKDMADYVENAIHTGQRIELA